MLDSASFFSASSSLALRLWEVAIDFCPSIAALSSFSRFWSWVYSAWSPPMICSARATRAFLFSAICASIFCTSGWAGLYFSSRRDRSTSSPAIWLLRPTTTASAATWGTESRLSPRARMSRSCCTAASMVMRRVRAAM